MSKIDTGGAAFPCNVETTFNSCGVPMTVVDGMSLRDWFAGKVAPSVRSTFFDNTDVFSEICKERGFGPCKVVAMASYELADALVAEKRRTEGA